MSKLILKFKLLSPDAKLPQYAHDSDAAFDIYATETVSLKPGERAIIKTGLASEIPEGWFVSLRDRSGNAAKFGLHVLAGVIDAGYTGEWGIITVNLGQEEHVIEVGDKIAQGILHECRHPEIIQIKELGDTERGDGGFGSTGRK